MAKELVQVKLKLTHFLDDKWSSCNPCFVFLYKNIFCRLSGHVFCWKTSSGPQDGKEESEINEDVIDVNITNMSFPLS